VRGGARRELLAVFAGGCAGTLARAALGEGLTHDLGGWPWATFVANIVGAFLLGAFAARLADRERHPLARPLLTTGFCGALTTFSTLQIELLDMLDEGALGLAFAYAAASVVVGLGAVTVGGRVAT
jgi:CrcB protein